MLNRTHLILTYKGLSYYSVPFSNNEAVSTLMKHIPELSIYIFIGSANGLVIASGYDHRRSFSTFVVLNLMTKDSVVLPNYMKHQKRVEGAPGFGYDSMTDDYKVVAIFHTKSSSNVYVYSLGTYIVDAIE
ncbi:hypothetical protein Tco_0954557 [Tanacetum coccineum]|uniref:F-box associated beta-propeller type 3 domain-containing protein n=1 Tax=Tanacetum coccineum TaxID=301880 RepID=A0ABQ5E4Q6_9ASTR